MGLLIHTICILAQICAGNTRILLSLIYTFKKLQHEIFQRRFSATAIHYFLYDIDSGLRSGI